MSESESGVTVVLPDGQTVRLTPEMGQRLVEQYKTEGYYVIKQGNLYIITHQPKQA